MHSQSLIKSCIENRSDDRRTSEQKIGDLEGEDLNNSIIIIVYHLNFIPKAIPMKTTIISLLFILIWVTGNSQNLNYNVHARYDHPITKEKLEMAKTMADLIPYYPSSWIKGYNSVELTVTGNGKTISATGTNENLTAEQAQMLASLDLGSEIVINISYQSENFLTHETENGQMHYSATVVPEVEARFPNGYEQLTEYIKLHGIDQISADYSKDIQQAIIRFTINEDGDIEDAHISKTSGNMDIDRLLLETVNNMPAWNPASDANGNKVKQEFELTVSGGNEGC